MRFLVKLLLFLACPVLLLGQTTTVSGTVTDPDSIAWANGTITFALYNPSPGKTPTHAGVPLTAQQLNPVFNLDNTGSFSGSVFDNTQVSPVGTQWNITICPAASSPCQNLVRMSITGASLNLTSTIGSQITALRLPASYTARAYATVEISPIPPSGATFFNLTAGVVEYWNGSIWQPFGSGGGGTSNPPTNSIQIAGSTAGTFNSDPNFTINAVTHLRTSAANDQTFALSSIPRATFDPMDTRYCSTTSPTTCGLQAAIAIEGSVPSAPAEVITAAWTAGICSIEQNTNIFHAINIPLPQGTPINITGIKYWGNSSFGGDPNTFGPTLQHVDATQIMVQAHTGADTVVCGGTTYTPGGAGGVYIHNIGLAGMFNPNTDTDIGLLMNCTSCSAVNIYGSGNAFGGPAFIQTGTSVFSHHLGQPGAQLQGCVTYTGGVRPVSGFTLGNETCGAAMDLALDGGMDDVYASDGVVTRVPNHGAGSCYPSCAAIVLGGSGNSVYDNDLFPQISDIDLLITSNGHKVHVLRADYTSREAVKILSSGATLDDVTIDSACTDNTLSSAYGAGTPTGCFPIVISANGLGSIIYNFKVVNNSGIFSQSYNQAWVSDGQVFASGASDVFSLFPYQGNPANTSSNDWFIYQGNTGAQTSPRIVYPDAVPMDTTSTTPNVSGITAIRLTGSQTVTNFTAPTTWQHLFVYSNGAGAVSNGGSIFNLNNQTNTFANTTQVLEYVNGGSQTNPLWIQIGGPAQQTPTHVNFAGNPTPSLPSLIHVIGNNQASQQPIPSFGGGFQIGGTTTTGQACFVLTTSFPDGSFSTSAQQCTNVNIPTNVGGVFASGPNTISGAITNLWIISDTQPTTVPLGKYPAISCISPSNCSWQAAVINPGGNGATPMPTPGSNNTGALWGYFIQPSFATAPSGTCTADNQDQLAISQDGHGTWCPTGGGTWTTKW